MTALQHTETTALRQKYIDLHAHLDGCITPSIAKELAGIQHMELPCTDERELLSMLSVPDSCKSLNDFLQCFDLPCSLLQTPDSLCLAVKLVLAQMKKDGVIYAELRFAPQLHTRNGMTQEDAVCAALRGLEQADIPANLILCCMRGSGNDVENERTLELAHKYLVKDHGVTALDLAGAEGLFPTGNYIELFKKASSLHIPFTIHAGEAGTANDVKIAIEMGAARIGHGVRICQSSEIMELVRDRKIPLEMCPTSNRQTNAVTDMKHYPLLQFLDFGIKVTVNTDDMAIERTSLPAEFRYLREQFGLTVDHEKQLLMNAVDAAFASEETKGWLRNRL